ncbi:MAG: Na/Pi cotransporter family protein [Candidatus Gastranaerophilales bacterium]|nr:Na/Pi cotransporter family protein [Candidatus Gastranaerophilales bacterium]
MTIFSIFTLCGGLAFFLYGMQVLSAGLEKIADGKLEKLLREMTSNPAKGFALGAVITIAIQSSSALTVMLVGLVNSGIMELGQTISVVMGANVGTTLTAWILSLSGISSDNIFLQMLKPANFSPLFALGGVCMMMISKNNRKKSVGSVLVGFAILMFGMILMSDAMSPLAKSPEFSSILTVFTNPLLGVLVGAVFTGIIQSSAAAVGILQALSLTGLVSYGISVPLIMGMNVGTCVTALISSIGVNTNAKRVAVTHIICNVMGVIICLPIFLAINYFLNLNLNDKVVNPVGIAVCHTIFNVATTIFLFPFIKQIEKFAKTVVKEKSDKDSKTEVFLDERILLSPAFAISECNHHAVSMADMTEDILIESIKLLKKYDEAKAEYIFNSETKIDNYEDKLGTFLVKLSGKELTESDNNQVSKLLHTLSDFERISDHAVTITFVAKEMHEKNMKFSKEAMAELDVLTNALTEILSLTVSAFETDDSITATDIEPLEQVIDGLVLEIKNRHIERLQNGACTIDLGFMLSDLLNCYQRVSDHCSNIAACVIQMKYSQLDMHNYLNSIKTGENEHFAKEFEKFQEKYTLDIETNVK